MLVPALGAGGFGLWGRFPLEVVTPMRGGSMIAARVQVPGVRIDPVIARVRITNPLALYGQACDQWQNGIAAAKVRMADLAATAGAGAVIVAGDFNSTPDMRQFRDLLSDDYRDAVDQIGVAPGADVPLAPGVCPLIAIDRLITRNAAVSSIHTVRHARD